MAFWDFLTGGSGSGFDPNDPFAGNTLGATPDVTGPLTADPRADPNAPAFGDPFAGNTIAANAPAGGWGAGSGSGTGSGGKPWTQKAADALLTLGKATAQDQQHSPTPVQARLDLSPRSAQSQAFRGQSSLGSLVQALLQRQAQYGPPGTGGGGGGRGGLLGF